MCMESGIKSLLVKFTIGESYNAVPNRIEYKYRNNT